MNIFCNAIAPLKNKITYLKLKKSVPCLCTFSSIGWWKRASVPASVTAQHNFHITLSTASV
jgi:hypothetical protein